MSALADLPGAANLGDLLAGLWITLYLSVASFLGGALLALPVALARRNGPGMLRAGITVAVSFLRGTPLLAQVFLVYYGSGQLRMPLEALGLWTWFREPMFCVLLTFVFNTAAYQSELLRGGLMGVAPGEIEGGRAVGMRAVLLHRRVILPHAYRIAWPGLGNEFVLMVKGSAIASVVTILDLTGQARLIFARTFDFTVYLQAAVLYLAISATFVWLWRRLERGLTPGLSGSSPAGSAASLSAGADR